jgi:uncharacterized membrane protein YkvA (DUF1232 family)
MPLTISFQLSDRDLAHFSARMGEARAKAASTGEQGILAEATKMLAEIDALEMPDFVRERIDKLRLLLDMIRDKAWNVAGEDRVRIVNAIAYVVDPEDMIPDHIPGIGLLDDAVMIELVCQDLRHDIEAYQDFCRFRDKEVARRGAAGKDLTQQTWLAARRLQLHDRVRRRRATLWSSRLDRTPPPDTSSMG